MRRVEDGVLERQSEGDNRGCKEGADNTNISRIEEMHREWVEYVTQRGCGYSVTNCLQFANPRAAGSRPG